MVVSPQVGNLLDSQGSILRGELESEKWMGWETVLSFFGLKRPTKSERLLLVLGGPIHTPEMFLGVPVGLSISTVLFASLPSLKLTARPWK